jgi:anti-sigma B factor antagonist
MPITKNVHGDTCELFVKDRVDGALANEMEVQILGAMKQGARTILINLAETNFLCSAALRILLQYHRQMKNQQKVLMVSRISPEADAILDMTGFRDILVEKV